MSTGQLQRTAWTLLAPALVLMAAILVLPVLAAAMLSLTDYSLGNESFRWVGFENYHKLFTRSTYEKMFTATFLYVLVVVPLSMGLGLGAALLINSVGHLRNLYKTIYFLPVMATLIAMAIAWEFMLHPSIGVVNQFLESLCGSRIEPVWPFLSEACSSGMPLWLGDRRYAIWVVCFIGIWQGFGFNMVLFLAGLTAVPRELYLAAEIDGARGAWDRFRLVTWPALGPTSIFVFTISCIRSFQAFDTIEALFSPGGGPGKTAYMMMFAIYDKGIVQNLVGIGAAITVLFLVLVMVLTTLQHRHLDRKVHYT